MTELLIGAIVGAILATCTTLWFEEQLELRHNAKAYRLINGRPVLLWNDEPNP